MEAIEVIVVRLDARPGSVERAARWLSAPERERAARFRFDADRCRFIAARGALRGLLGARAGVAPGALRLELARHGKPALAGSRWQFNVSRSRDLAGYAFSRDRAVGIDVEVIRPLAEADAIAARSFPRRERLAYAALAAGDKVRGFFRCWTRMEALSKALGGGFTMPREALDAALDDGWVVCSFAPAPGFAGALAYAPRRTRQ